MNYSTVICSNIVKRGGPQGVILDVFCDDRDRNGCIQFGIKRGDDYIHISLSVLDQLELLRAMQEARNVASLTPEEQQDLTRAVHMAKKVGVETLEGLKELAKAMQLVDA